MYSTSVVKKRFENFVENSINDTFKITYDDGYKIDYHLTFNYEIEEKKLTGNYDNPTLKIPNYNLFVEKLTNLLNLMGTYHLEDKDYYDFSFENFIDYLLVCFFSNMNEYDLNNSLNYLDRLIQSYNQKYDYQQKKAGNISIKNKEIEIHENTSKNKASMEAPLHQTFFFKNNDECFYLPKIHYYIANNNCYIMAIQNHTKKQENSISKFLDRYFRKLDKGLDNIERSENGEINNIKDISPNALAALTLFVSYHKNISDFYFPSYLPLRYTNKLETLKIKGLDLNEADRIQSNLTNKLLFTGLRLCEHFNRSEIYLNDDGFLKIKFNPSRKNDDNIIKDIYNSINFSNKKK